MAVASSSQAMHPGLPEGKPGPAAGRGVGAGSSRWWFVTSLCSFFEVDKGEAHCTELSLTHQRSLVSSTLVYAEPTHW